MLSGFYNKRVISKGSLFLDTLPVPKSSQGRNYRRNNREGVAYSYIHAHIPLSKEISRAEHEYIYEYSLPIIVSSNGPGSSTAHEHVQYIPKSNI